MATTECCVVCAEPLEWTAIGECGHTETCSHCAAKMRFVLKDNACVMCKQELSRVFITRYMGDYTARLRPDQFADLQNQANRGELFHITDISAYCDDSAHFKTLKDLCGYTHPFITQKCKEANRDPPQFTSIQGMKRFVDMHYKMQFCDLCVQSRKVFLCEQLLYTKAELDKHNKSGDDTGPLAGTSFKGHPLCKFCKKRFYDPNELYRHMESEHEHCFICRRQRPSEYTYFRHYQELEEHFQSQHHPCPHPACLERKFVVFAEERELKRHFAQEHPESLSKAEKRDARMIPVNVQYRDTQAEAAAAAAFAMDRPAVVIGGGDQVPTRHGRNRAPRVMDSAGAGSSSHHRHLGYTPSEENPSSVSFSQEDFPQVQGSGQTAVQMTGRWGGYIPGLEAGSSSAAGGSSRGAFEEHFPALPSMSKAAKKKLRAQQAAAASGAGTSSGAGASGSGSGSHALVDQLRAANMPVRIVNRASNSAAQRPRPQPEPPAAPHPAAASPETTSSSALSRSSSAAVPEPTAPPARPPQWTPAATTTAAAAGSSRPGSSSAAATTPSPEDFPSLPSAPAASRRNAPVPAPAPSRFVSAVITRPASSPSLAQAAAASSSTSPEPALLPEDFPTLAPTSRNKPAANSKGGKSQATAQAHNRSPSYSHLQASIALSPPTSPPQAHATATSAETGATAAGGVSKSLQQANKQLILKIQGQLSDEARFADFKRQSQAFLRGELSAESYHGQVLAMGLMALVPELAALCPAAERRDALLAAHAAYLTTPAAQRPTAGWVPPEAALAATQKAAQMTSWACDRCTLVNAPECTHCEACGSARTRSSTGRPSVSDAFPTLASAYGQANGGAAGSTRSGGAGASSSSAAAGSSSTSVAAAPAGSEAGPSVTDSPVGKKQKGKAVKITIGLGAGTGRSAAAIGQGHTASKGAWNGAGGQKVAKMHHAINDAWGH